MTRHAYLSVLLISALAPPLAAQSEQPDSIHWRNQCRLAAQTIASTHPAPHAGWAITVIQNCPEGGHVLADALREVRTSRDTALIDAITRPAIKLRDGELFGVALDIAGDRIASIEARIFSIRTLMWAMYPGGALEYDDLADLRPSGQRSCFGAGPSTHTIITRGATPLPPDYVARAKAVAQRLNEDAGEPRPVRRAAVCLLLLEPWPALRN